MAIMLLHFGEREVVVGVVAHAVEVVEVGVGAVVPLRGPSVSQPQLAGWKFGTTNTCRGGSAGLAGAQQAR